MAGTVRQKSFRDSADRASIGARTAQKGAMMRYLTGLAGLAVAVAAGCAATPILADSIDGNWCEPSNGRAIRIEGEKAVTPGGQAVIGAYSRHEYIYKVPPDEPGAGGLVQMHLLSETKVEVTEPAQSPVIWNRCDLNT